MQTRHFIVDDVTVEITGGKITHTLPPGMTTAIYRTWLFNNRDALTIIKEGTPLEEIAHLTEIEPTLDYYNRLFGYRPNYPAVFARKRIARALSRIEVVAKKSLI